MSDAFHHHSVYRPPPPMGHMPTVGPMPVLLRQACPKGEAVLLAVPQGMLWGTVDQASLQYQHRFRLPLVVWMIALFLAAIMESVLPPQDRVSRFDPRRRFLSFELPTGEWFTFQPQGKTELQRDDSALLRILSALYGPRFEVRPFRTLSRVELALLILLGPILATVVVAIAIGNAGLFS